jgi:hypothetical protein
MADVDGTGLPGSSPANKAHEKQQSSGRAQRRESATGERGWMRRRRGGKCEAPEPAVGCFLAALFSAEEAAAWRDFCFFFDCVILQKGAQLGDLQTTRSDFVGGSGSTRHEAPSSPISLLVQILSSGCVEVPMQGPQAIENSEQLVS